MRYSFRRKPLESLFALLLLRPAELNKTSTFSSRSSFCRALVVLPIPRMPHTSLSTHDGLYRYRGHLVFRMRAEGPHMLSGATSLSVHVPREDTGMPVQIRTPVPVYRLSCGISFAGHSSPRPQRKGQPRDRRVFQDI